MTTIKRSLFKTFLNTGTIAVPVWSLIGDGVPVAEINYNPKTTEQTYIHEDNATITIDGYAPVAAIEAIAKNGDAVFEFIDALRIARAPLDDAITEVVNVWLYETPVQGYYLAERQSVAIQVDTFGGEGGAANKLNYTINFLGDPVQGSYHPTDETFVDGPILASLTSLSVGGHTLTPVFNGTWLWYTLAVSAASDVITAVADSAAAVIVIDVDATPVVNGEAAIWAEGANTLTVEVTVGAEVVEYVVIVTYTA